MPAIRSIQAPAAAVMIRPHKFTPNPETAADNAFQSPAAQKAAQAVADAGHREVTVAVERLQAEGVRVHLFEDHGDRDTPDSVFPNNWLAIERSVRLVPLSVPTVEMAGGSVRCMIAGIHLSPRH